MPTPGAFLIADPVHVDSPAYVADTASRFPLADQTPPDGWRVAEHGGWVMWHPPHAHLPQQGWKVHVSVGLDDAADVLDLVRDHCVRHRVAFKFQRSRRLALVNNEKYAHRAGSGKLAALYPADDTALRRILDDLGARLAGYRGPYVLSDLRWHDGPLYLRYGGFAELWCVDGDQPVPAVARPDGTLVPDRREPVFTAPDWAPVPDFVAEHIAAVDAQTDDEPPYRIEEALHHSNAGGVYRATDLRDGRTVVLREARPLAGLDGAGTDALTRLRREEDMLRRLAGLDCVPRLLDRITWWEHQFLVEEHIEGDTLQHHLAMRHPLIHPDPTEKDLTDYTTWALDVIDQVEAALAQIHARGVVFGDLHTANVMIRPDGRVVLVDFEQAYLLDEDFTPSLGDPGFATPRIRRGPAVDRYALACLRLAVFVPLTPLAALCDDKFDDLLTIARRFPLPPGYLDRIRDDLHTALNPPTPTPGRRVTRYPWPADPRQLIASLAAGIRATATPHRTDRLFPGDPGQFPHGGATLAHGAAGVIWALVNTGVDYPERDEHLDWLTRAARRLPAAHLGLYDGLAGIAALLDRTGRHDDAGELLDRCRTGLHDRYGPSLHSGLAGIGLALLRPGRPAPDDALHIGDRLARTLTGDTTQPVPEPARPGLLHGWSGPAIFLTRLHEATGDPAWLRAARTALRRDLQHTVRDDNGNLHVRDGARRLFYLDEGSAGIAVAAHTLLRHGERPWLRDIVTTVQRTIDVEFVLLPGLFHGRAGLLATAALLTDDPPRTTPHGPVGLVRHGAPRHTPAHLNRLAWHAYALDGRLAFPGDTLLRISTDLAAGGAGILSAIHAALHRTTVTLPFLDAPTHVAPTGHLLAAS
ncbi:class III lanthionine synthetase LanKC [Micromonospora sp. C32]|uniref:class III lanthionine synthetase LanKC n=1 Tax=unclassified Micromonospora TaxID=2617518 RepID=UPI001B38C543|nr:MULTISPECIES: class III lanthionine synthetase LanKC [unclassified Micromonospora]MBQ1046471.1 class III lanthionine synthetase LanKC [Micromonospora sp. C72]MBQ1058653.1 class III lanthionine synthetase LanKC [Micromonospora sp. C32]